MGRGGMGLPRNPTDRMRGTPWQDRKQQPEQFLSNLLTPEVRSSIDFALKKQNQSWQKATKRCFGRFFGACAPLRIWAAPILPSQAQNWSSARAPRPEDASCRLAHGFADSRTAQSGRTPTTG